MRMFHALLLAAVGFSAQAPAATIVELDATDPTPTAIELIAGTYVARLIADLDGSAPNFTAWSAWPANMDCGTVISGPGSCERGFLNRYRIESPEIPGQNVGSSALGFRFETPELALAAAQPFTFTLTGTQMVALSILDSNSADNRGGLTLSVERVALPAPLALLLAAMAGLGIVRRKRRTA